MKYKSTQTRDFQEKARELLQKKKKKKAKNVGGT